MRLGEYYDHQSTSDSFRKVTLWGGSLSDLGIVSLKLSDILGTNLLIRYFFFFLSYPFMAVVFLNILYF